MGLIENFLLKQSNKFTEYHNNSFSGDAKLDRLSNLGAISFGPGITDKKVSRTPHYDIKKSFDMYEQNVIVASAVNQLVSFVIPNKTMKVASKDEKSVIYVESFCELRPHLMEEVKNFLTTRILCGNAPAETIFNEKENKGVEFDNFFSYNDASRIYINPDDEDGKQAFILEVPIGLKSFVYRGVNKQPQWIQVTYIKNYQYVLHRVYGVWLSSDELYFWKSGWSRDNIYGRSQLIAAVDADNILKEIMSTWDTVVRTRRSDIKIYSVADAETGKRYTQEQMDKLTDKLSDTASSFKLINIPLKLAETEIKTTGTYDLFEGVFDIVRRMIIMALLPQHLTPWNDSATTQGSETAMPPFLLRVKSLQQELINVLNDVIINNLRKSESWIAKDTTFVFDEPIIMGQDYYVRVIMDLVNGGVIKTTDAKKYLLKIGILDEDVMDDNKKVADIAGDGIQHTDREILISYEEFKKNQKVIKERL